PSSSPTSVIIWRSRCFTRRAHRRLIILLLLLFGRWGPGGLRLLAQEVEVDDLARDRRGGAAAVAAVFHQDREGDLGIVRRRVGDEQGVVAMTLLDSRFVVLLPLHADHLRRAGLAGEQVLGVHAGPGRRAARAGDV